MSERFAKLCGWKLDEHPRVTPRSVDGSAVNYYGAYVATVQTTDMHGKTEEVHMVFYSIDIEPNMSIILGYDWLAGSNPLIN